MGYSEDGGMPDSLRAPELREDFIEEGNTRHDTLRMISMFVSMT
jgi:hypothetical protein